MVLWTELAPGIHFGSDDMAMDIHATSHDYQTGGVNGLGLSRVDFLGRDDPSVLDPYVLYLILDPMCWIVHPTISDS
jgi:hypothetical protein